ncbi:MAG TPA: hypothetical protein VHZ53_02615 [Steroidobacteraceae bacterium]|jgi:hypothetical protein|nr:hypothetical protein [Steroidobacteraceae bacterium]
MKKLLALLLLGLTFAAGAVLAADAVVGSWTLNVAKSKFASGPAPASGTRVYTEADGGYALDQKITGSDGKEAPFKAHYKDGEDETVAGANGIDSIHAKKVNAHTWDFSMKSGGKEVGHVHRTVSADGKTLTVHNTGKQPSGATGDDTMVFDKK